jgi:hypothetical protein
VVLQKDGEQPIVFKTEVLSRIREESNILQGQLGCNILRWNRLLKRVIIGERERQEDGGDKETWKKT